MFFSKEYGQLKAWIYSWHYASNDHKAVTGQLLSYSFQDSKLYGLIYKNNIITRWGYLETGLPKVEQGNKKTQSIFGAGFFKALWCVLTGRDWNDQTKIDGHCVEGSTVGAAIETVISFISNLFDGSSGSGNSGGEFSGGFFLFNGAPPVLPQPENGANVGDPNTTQNYVDGYPYAAVWVPAQPDSGCPVTSPNGDQQPIGTIDDSPTGPNCNTQGHWVSVPINENNVTTKLITRLGITDANKQSYLYNNADIAGELYLYLLQSSNTQDDVDFVNWAVEYLMENPSVTIEVFKNQYLNPIITNPINDNWTDADNIMLNDPDQTNYQEYQDGQPWPNISNVIPFNAFVPNRYIPGSNIETVNCLILSKEQLANKGYTVSGYDSTSTQLFQVYKEASGVDISKTRKAISYMTSALSNGIPVLVGVDVRPGAPSANKDHSTDHFIVIVGMGTDNKGKYFRFMDSSTNWPTLGASENNKLYFDSLSKKISGKTMAQYGAYQGHHDYIITQVRKSIHQ